MNRIAKFEKVSREQFEKDYKDNFKIFIGIDKIYDDIKLPHRSTKGSAGYDFCSPVDIVLSPGKSVVIPSGIRAWMSEGWVLQCYPRSGLGFKYGMRIANTTPIIDSDYYYSESNEGHIMFKIVNGSENNTLLIKAGEKFIQGIFVPYGITEDDDADGVRDGGFGSTGVR